jgi:hypothetical protein
MEDKTPLEKALSKEDNRVILEKHSMWYDEKVKPIKGKSFLENLNEYEPLDVKTFIGENKEEKTDDKYWFYKKNYKHIIPFIFRKNRKLNFTYFIASKNKRINDIRDMTTRLNAFYKNGTQKAPVKKSREKFFENLLNTMKYFFSFKQKYILKKLWKNRKYFIPYLKNNKEKISLYSFETYVIRQQPKVKSMLNFMRRLDRIKI